jgi:hypothetical protein
VDDENEIPTQADSAENPPKAEDSIKEFVSTEEDGPTRKAVAIEVIKDQPENKAPRR